MSFTPKTYQEIFEEMRGRTSSLTDFSVGSVTRTLYESLAYEMGLLYEKMQRVYLAGYIDTAEGTQLDQVVAILGLERGLPDYAEGAVTFSRDLGNEGITIPLGTLIATEDSPETPKKVYQTLEVKVLAADQTSVSVKVQAVNRGEEQNAAAETVSVMPRPIPGIKAVNNPEAIRLTGKRRESDQALRERAKNTLISSGKATILSIENALLTLPGVKDAKVKENFHFAEGEATFQITDAATNVTLPKGTALLLTFVPGGSTRPYVTLSDALLPDNVTGVDVPVRAVWEGELGELKPLPAPADMAWSLPNGPASVGVSVTEPIALKDFGIIEVFVDGPDLNDPAEKAKMQTEIEKVRAAGILVLLRSVRKVNLEAIFRIDLLPSLNLNAEERVALEQLVQATIITYLEELKMGAPLVFTKIIKTVLDQEGVDNLSDLRIYTTKTIDGNVISGNYDFAQKSIPLEEFERVNTNPEESYICVASEDKPLPVYLEFQLTFPNPNDTVENKMPFLETAVGNIENYFSGLSLGSPVSQNAIVAAITGVTVDPATFRMRATSWCPRPMIEAINVPTPDTVVRTSFVERPRLATVFAYESTLDIVGALKLTLPVTVNATEKKAIQEAVMVAVMVYFDSLAPEEDIVLDQLVELTTEVDRVLAVDIDEDDFRVSLNGTEPPGRVQNDKITLDPFEKARVAHLCVSADIETVEVEVTSLTVQASSIDPLNPYDPAALRTGVSNAINQYLSDADPGEDLIVANLLSAAQVQVPGAIYTVTGMSLTATSRCDDRIQTSNMTTLKDIHVRSIEQATMLLFDPATITITT